VDEAPEGRGEIQQARDTSSILASWENQPEESKVLGEKEGRGDGADANLTGHIRSHKESLLVLGKGNKGAGNTARVPSGPEGRLEYLGVSKPGGDVRVTWWLEHIILANRGGFCRSGTNFPNFPPT
jgi:hypothetical protein